MILSALSNAERRDRLAGPGLVIRTGPFVFRLCSPHALVSEGLAAMYADHPVLASDALADFDVAIDNGPGLRRLVRRQARFVFDGHPVFEPLPADQAYPLLEWAMNWCISGHAHQYLIVHAAVIERGGRALILPAPPGSGKSTLCVALIHAGWRLLSDELTMIRMDDGFVVPLCRPVSLKNESIDVIRQFAPHARFSRVTHDTAKGSVAHVKVPTAHLAQMDVTALPRWIVYPQFSRGAATAMTPRPRGLALIDLARNAFNFQLQGEAGFERLCQLVKGCDTLDFCYSDLPEALVAFERLAAGT